MEIISIVHNCFAGVMGWLFVVTETKQRSGLYSLFHLSDLNVPLDLALNTKWALLILTHDTIISPLVL